MQGKSVSRQSLHKRVDAQDAAGWKTVIFLPFNVVWQVVLMITIFFVFVATTIMITYDESFNIVLYTVLCCDLLYMIDVCCSVLHILLTETRKVRSYLPKSMFLLFIDFLSLIPSDLIYMAVIWQQGGHSDKTRLFLLLNRNLRIYRFYYYFRYAHFTIQSIESGYIISYLELFTYGILLSHVWACIFHMIKGEDDLKICPKESIECIFLNELNIYTLMFHRFVGSESMYDTWEKRLTICIIITIGHIYSYGFMTPMFVFSCLKRLRTFFEFLNRFKRLRIFLNNVIEDGELKKKALSEFQVVWTYGRGDVPPELLSVYPTNLIKNIYSDMYWDAFSHSELLRNISYGCKRSLSRFVIGDLYRQNTVFWDFGEKKNCIIYVASGVIQVMAEENSTSPIMSFSGGTVLGEVSLFYPTITKAILRVTAFSELHIIKAKNFFRVIQDYPHDKEIIHRNLAVRFLVARTTNLRKREISKVIFNRQVGEVGDFNVADDDSIKWIKTQCRIMSELNKIHIEGKHPQLMATKLNDLKTTVEHTSVYLPLLNLGEEIEVMKDITCLKTTIPWVMDPESHFIKFWKLLLLIPVCFSVLSYPAILGWYETVPKWLFSMSQLLCFIYFIDIIMQLSTAVKKKTRVTVNSSGILVYHLKKFSFYADLITAIPLPLFFYSYPNEEYGDALFRVSIAVALLKMYKIVIFLNGWCENLWGMFRLRIMFKYVIYYLTIIYWSAALFQILDVKCFFKTCSPGRWYNPEMEKIYVDYKDLASAYFAINLLGDVPIRNQYSHNFPSVIYIFLSLQVMQYLIMVWNADLISAYILESSQEVKFKFLVQSLMNFMNTSRIKGRIKRRVLDMMTFQWYYDRGDFITQKRSMLEDAPEKLKAEVNKATVFNYFRNSELLKAECDEFIWHLCNKSYRLALPANAILVTFGVQTTTFYLVYKGHLQVNSFLPNDVIDSLATPQSFGPGSVLPLIIVLNQMPSAVTARTLTDAELIVVRLEDFLTGSMIYDSFKDLVDAIKEIDTKPFLDARLTISKVTEHKTEEQYSFKQPFRRIGFIGWLLSKILMKWTINNNSSAYLRWELFMLFCFVCSAFSWPVLFALTASNGKTIAVYVLLALDSFSMIDLYVKLHLCFYNSKGIHVTHPLMTCFHYVTTSFYMSLLFIVPFCHSIYLIITDYEFNVPYGTAFYHSILRGLCLGRVLLFLTNRESIGTGKVKSISYIFFSLIIFHIFILLRMLREVEWVVLPDGSKTITYSEDSWIKLMGFKGQLSLSDRYLILSYFVIMLMFRTFPVFSDYNLSNLLYTVFFSTLGTIITFFCYGYFISRKTGARLNFTVYQFHMNNFKEFLRTEKADDSITNMAIKHFEHEWERKNGEDLHDLFVRLPEILHEDLIFPVYRSTLTGLPCFSGANEGFYRTLSRMFSEVHFRSGSIIIFEMGVNKDIYFVHRGQCKVGNTILPKGSIIGDIKRKSLMKSTVEAQTHVVLLSIKSTEFFLVLNNFYETEQAYMEAVKEVSDYIASNYNYEYEDIPDVTAKVEITNPEQSSFEPEEVPTAKKTAKIKTFRLRKFTIIIRPDSRLGRVLSWIAMTNAFMTSILLPLIISLHLHTFGSLIFVYVLDGIWLLKILAKLRTSYYSEETGRQVTQPRLIFKHYVKSVDGFIIDVLALLPLEWLNRLIVYCYSSWPEYFEVYCYSLRLLRLVSLFHMVERNKKDLSLNDWTRWFLTVMRQFVLYSIFTAVALLLATDDKLVIEDFQDQFTYNVMDVLIWAYLSMVSFLRSLSHCQIITLDSFQFNMYTATGMYILPPKTLLQFAFYVILSIYSVYERIILIGEVLSIINVSLFVKSEKLYRLQLMEKYVAVSITTVMINGRISQNLLLQARDMSPALRKRLIAYGIDLLQQHKLDVMPFFLREAPYYIKVQIMQDLFLEYIRNCNVFAGIKSHFLKQLAARLKRNIYFPGDTIIEAGDVDCCMYFVHRGKVASLEKDPLYPGLSYETGFFKKGDNFGILQGLARAVPHTATYKAVAKSDVLSLNFLDWLDLRIAFPAVKDLIEKRSKHLVDFRGDVASSSSSDIDDILELTAKKIRTVK